MPEGGTVIIRAENIPTGTPLPPTLPHGDYVHIAIIDQGCGISPAMLRRVFEPYVTTKPDGTGLGLATAYSIMRRHDGIIEAESEVGRGSTFHLYLPARSEVASRIAPYQD